MAKANPDGKPMTEDVMQLSLGLQLRTSTEWYGNVADCKGAGAAINCLLESDGGKFTLSAAEGGALKLETGDYGLAFECEKDAIDRREKGRRPGLYSRTRTARRMRCGNRRRIETRSVSAKSLPRPRHRLWPHEHGRRAIRAKRSL